MFLLCFFLLSIVFVTVIFWFVLKSRNMQIWVIAYLKQIVIKKTPPTSTEKHIYVCLADHYEPYFADATQEKARSYVKKWVENYREVSRKHTDSNGRHPQHSCFYPQEEYDEWVLQQLKDLKNDELGDVEIHLHHDNDTAENLEKTLNEFKELLYKEHGLLRKDQSGNIVYGFIHGNWALDNSRPDGRWCGIDNELEVLIKTGCEYDMTMPSAPSDTQTRTINEIYLAKEDGLCKSHDKGKKLHVGEWKKNDELLMIQGPLTLNWKYRKFGLMPRIESGELSGDAPPTGHRVKLWENCGVSVEGAEEHVFIKLHTHGLQDQNMNMFFENSGFDILWTLLEDAYKNRDGYQLHYVTAWEMFEKVRSIAQSGK